jgi:hypothetical protein
MRQEALVVFDFRYPFKARRTGLRKARLSLKSVNGNGRFLSPGLIRGRQGPRLSCRVPRRIAGRRPLLQAAGDGTDCRVFPCGA